MTAGVINLGGVSASWLADQLDRNGVVRLPNAFSDRWLDGLRGSVTEHIADHGEGDLLIPQPDREPGSPVHELVADPALQQLFDECVELRFPGLAAAQSIKSGIPVRAGTGVRARSNLFHYDATVLTMIVPIVIPRAEFGSCGELVAMTNKRPFRRFVASHLVDVLLTYNSAYRRRVADKVLADPEKYVVDLQPGDAYLFWGYRTYHGNLVCAPGRLRAVLVLQYADVHSGSRVLSLAWRFGRSRRALRRFQYRGPVDTASPAGTSTNVT